jgi:PAS domain S-box-containing protein/putative nucleotidyltransferase with HDIG domain
MYPRLFLIHHLETNAAIKTDADIHKRAASSQFANPQHYGDAADPEYQAGYNRHGIGTMTRIEIIYLTPYFTSLLLTATILFLTWKKRHAQSAAVFGIYVLAQTLWIAGFIFELVSPQLEEKIFWDGFQWLCRMAILVALPAFLVQFSEHPLRNQRQWLLLSLIAPLSFTLLLTTDLFHHWIYSNPRLIPGFPFSELRYDFTALIYGYAVYAYAIISWGFYILLRRIFQPHGFYRAQIFLIALGILIPTIGTILSLLGIQIAPQRDAAPFTIAIGNLIIAWGLFRFRIFEVAPIAREKVFEAMLDPVVILDNQNLIVDINAAMLALLGSKAGEVIGKPAKTVFADFPIPIKLYTHVSHARTETLFELHGKKIHYEMTVWPLYSAGKNMAGRIYISHDITALKELETELRTLNMELEKRVNSRTQELAEAYESMLEGFARALELRDKETEGHSRRVTENTLKIALNLGITGRDLENIRRGAILHDIGKISIPDEILHKPGKLTSEERLIIEKHPETAYKLLSPIPFLKKALEIPYCHHEKWDGTGYPRGLKCEEIPLSARIFAIADVWDALSNDRPYNKAWSREKIIEYFKDQSGKHFDPALIRLFLCLVEKGGI